VAAHPEAQWANGMAAEGANVAGADSPTRAPEHFQLLEPWQVPPRCWPKLMRDDARKQLKVC
jgi:hypothetical protein